MGSAIAAITFPHFLTDKERYNLLNYFRMGIIEEIRFFFFDVKDPVRKIEKQGVRIAKKMRLKSTQGIHRKI